MDQIIAGVILTVILLIGVDVALNIKDRINRNIARKRMESMLCKGLKEIEEALEKEIAKVEPSLSAEEERKAKNRTKMAAYRAKKRAAKKTK